VAPSSTRRALLYGVWAWLQFFTGKPHTIVIDVASYDRTHTFPPTEFVVQLDVFKNSFFGILTLILYQLVRILILKVRLTPWFVCRVASVRQ
jgi:hypothetical protein